MKTVYKIKTSAYKETPYNIKTLKRSEGTIKNTKQNSHILECNLQNLINSKKSIGHQSHLYNSNIKGRIESFGFLSMNCFDNSIIGNDLLPWHRTSGECFWRLVHKLVCAQVCIERQAYKKVVES